MNIKKILGSYIENKTKRDMYLNGKRGEHYTISNFNFDKIAEKDGEQYNFFLNDIYNTYTFEKCLLNNLNFMCQMESVEFKNCSFSGNVTITNFGHDEESQIFLTNNSQIELLNSLSVKSPSITLFDNLIYSNNLTLLSNVSYIVNSILISKNMSLSFEKESEIEHSCINGEYIDNTKKTHSLIK